MKISFTIGKETRCNAQAAKEGVGSKSGIQGVVRMKGIGCGKKVEWTQPEQPVGFSFEEGFGLFDQGSEFDRTKSRCGLLECGVDPVAL